MHKLSSSSLTEALAGMPRESSITIGNSPEICVVHEYKPRLTCSSHCSGEKRLEGSLETA